MLRYVKDKDLTVPCKWCNEPTLMIGTRMCDRCWELDKRISADMELTRKIIKFYDNEGRGKMEQDKLINRKLTELIIKTDIIMNFEKKEYIGIADDNTEVTLGIFGEEDQIEKYLIDHPTPETW